ncbi:MAG: glycosyltransferase [Pseudomonadales bacterium]|nr:glycosyltransferase [Pseudomonadales bacterium]
MLILVALWAVSIVCLAIALHPFVTYPLSLLAWRRFRKSSWPAPVFSAPSEPLTFAVFVCAYNEEKVIALTLQRLIDLRVKVPGLEIMVHIDACTDRTAEIASQFASQINCLLIADKRRGKTEGMNLLVTESRADIHVFTDASVAIDADAFVYFQSHFRDPKIGAVCGKQVFTHADGSVNAASNAMYWRLEEKIKQWESEIGSIMTLDGSLYALRNNLRCPPPPDIVDDFYIPFMVMHQGYRVVQSQQAKSSEPSVTDASEEFRRKSRIACQGLNAHRVVWPVIKQMDFLTRYMYVSHKLIRWFTIYFLFLSVMAGFGALLVSGHYLVAAMAAGAMMATMFLGRVLKVKPFSTLTNILSAFVGVGLGVWQSINGQRYKVWEPPASARQPSMTNIVSPSDSELLSKLPSRSDELS